MLASEAAHLRRVVIAAVVKAAEYNWDLVKEDGDFDKMVDKIVDDAIRSTE